MLVELIHHAYTMILADPPSDGGGAPDFSGIHPDNKGIPKAGVIYTIADILEWLILAVGFLVFLYSLLTLLIAHTGKSVHLSDQSKTRILTIMVIGLLVTAAGGIWKWFTNLG